MTIEPAGHEDDIESVIACLGDDAAAMREENPEDERAANMDVAGATIASLCKQLDEARSAWHTVECNGLPPCNGHTTYIGINSAGYACCFNEIREAGMCFMATAEGAYRQMSDLRDWRLLDRPSPAPGSGLPAGQGDALRPIEQPCRKCRGQGYTDEGDPEIGSALFACVRCGGTGFDAAIDAAIAADRKDAG